MSVLFLLIPLSIAIAAFFLGAFIWAVRSGQYEDTGTPSLRLLMEDRAAKRPHREVVGSDAAPSRLLPRRVGRGEGWGEGKPRRVDEPPHPGPLLHPMEERERSAPTSECIAAKPGSNTPLSSKPN